MTDRLHVLLLEPFFTGSHEVWATGWQANSRHSLHLLTQPGTHWRHRMMAASVPLAEATREHVEAHGPPDVVVASDMVDLAGYLGLCRNELAGVPTVVYFHENQLTQPTSPNGVGGLRDRHLAWTNWRTLLAANEVWFNSRWQRDSMADALEDLLSDGPAGDDQRPLLAGARSRFRVRPVGCDLVDLLGRTRADDEQRDPLVVWNHRWAHDKGLDVAVASMRAVASQGVGFRLAVVGTDDHHDPARARSCLPPSVSVWCTGVGWNPTRTVRCCARPMWWWRRPVRRTSGYRWSRPSPRGVCLWFPTPSRTRSRSTTGSSATRLVV
ncbi:MAG: DUF3524 domain-containing protein [Microthrixaceae bacterium]|nr:DUF3524 domain-containing protein [Microthrixaceae bacterium]